MPGPEILNAPTSLEDGYHAPYCSGRGGARSAWSHPEGFSLWRLVAELDPGTELHWGAEHGDEALYVLEGGLEAGSQRCGPGGSVIVEAGAGAEASLRASAPTKLVHFGPVDVQPPTDGPLGAPRPDGHAVHVVPRGDAEVLLANRNPPRATMTSFADSTCPTCRITFFHLERDDLPSVAKSHFHSEDEIIHVLSGELQVGRTTVSSGMSLAIPANERYGFRSPGGHEFLNYRRDASYYVSAPGSEPELETIERTKEKVAQAAAQ